MRDGAHSSCCNVTNRDFNRGSLKVVESHLMDDDKLTEVLNVEISQCVIKSVKEAADWVKGTFLFQRMRSHPLMYGLGGNGRSEEALHAFVRATCTGVVDRLRNINAIGIGEGGTTFHPLPASHIMSRNFIAFKTMSSIVKLPHDSGEFFCLI